jgi:hypothetical protein
MFRLPAPTAAAVFTLPRLAGCKLISRALSLLRKLSHVRHVTVTDMEQDLRGKPDAISRVTDHMTSL